MSNTTVYGYLKMLFFDDLSYLPVPNNIQKACREETGKKIVLPLPSKEKKYRFSWKNIHREHNYPVLQSAMITVCQNFLYKWNNRTAVSSIFMFLPTAARFSIFQKPKPFSGATIAPILYFRLHPYHGAMHGLPFGIVAIGLKTLEAPTVPLSTATACRAVPSLSQTRILFNWGKSLDWPLSLRLIRRMPSNLGTTQ